MTMRPTVAPLCAAALTAAGTVSAPAAAQRAAPTLSATDVTTYAVVLRAADTRQLDTAALDGALHSPTLVVRVAGARALAQLAPTSRVDVIRRLRPLLGARDPGVVAAAAFGLGLAHDSASVAELARLAGTTADTTVARAAAWSLGELGARAAPTVDSLLAGAALHPTAARYVLLAASRLRAVQATRIVPFLSDPDTTTRWAAAYALARPHRSAGARPLLALRDQPAPVRAEIARALTASTVGDSLGARSVSRLASLARDPDATVRIAAIRSLGTFGAAAAAQVAAAFGDPDPQVRVAAAQSAAHVLARDTAAWRAAWSADTAYRFRRSLLESAAVAGVALPGASMWMADVDWRRRAAVVSALAAARDTSLAIVAALRAVRDADPRVRGTAYGALRALDSAAGDARVRAVFAAARAEPDTTARDLIPGVRDTAGVRVPPPRGLPWYERIVRTVVIPALSGRAARAVLLTERGPITVTLYGADTPLTVWNFVSLARHGFYDGLRFHRVVPAFVAQDGDPRGDGEGGPTYTIRDELTPLPYARGAVGMALSGPDTGGSQYFLTLAPQPHLDGHYTVFGMVTSGAGAMDALREGDLIRSIRIGNFDPQ